MDACRQAIGALLRRDIGQWRGLAADCRHDDLAAWLSFREGEGRAVLGAKRVDYAVRTASHAGFNADVGFHFRAGALALVATEYWSFLAAECAALLRQLGEPAHRLDFNWRSRSIADGEWVYVDRGITVGVIPETGLIAKVIVYQPCTLDHYTDRYHATKVAREFRRRR